MIIGYDAKRAFMNQSGLGNYSRTLISGITKIYPENKYELFTPKQKIDFINAANTSIVTPSKIIDKKISALWRSFEITNELIKNKVDIYHGLSAELPMNISKFEGKKIVTIHDLIYEYYPNDYPIIDRMMYRYKTKNSCKDADTIITVSESTKNDLVNLYQINPDKISVIPLAIDDSFFVKNREDNFQSLKEKYGVKDKFILNISTFIPRKNQLNLVKAFAKSNVNKECDLLLIGKDTSYATNVNNYIKEQNVLNVKIIHNVTDEDIKLFYKNASLFVYPSMYEGFGLPVAESLAMGTPVITSTISSMPEVGNEKCVYVDPHSIEDLTKAIEVNIDIKNEQFSQDIQAYSEKFKSEIFIQKNYEIISKI